MKKEIMVDAKTENLDQLTEMIEEMLMENGWGMGETMKINISFEEMFVNICHYAYEGVDENTPGYRKARIIIELADDSIEITLMDHGFAYNPLAKEDPDITLSVEERQIGGLGIFMVKKQMDEVAYERSEDGQNIFVMKKYREKRGE